MEQLMYELRTVANNLQQLLTTRDKRIAEVAQYYNPDIIKHQAAIAAMTDAAEAWAVANPLEFPTGRRSLQMSHGELGFRTSPPSVKPLNRKFTLDKILALMRRYLPGYIRTVEDIDREAIIASRNEPIVQDTLVKCGLRIIQTTKFYVEPKLDQVEPRQTKTTDQQAA